MIFDYLPQLARTDGIKYCCSAFFLVTAIVPSNWDSVSTLLLKGTYFLHHQPDSRRGQSLITNTSIRQHHDGVVIRASASLSVNLGFIPLVEPYQKTLKNGIHSFPAWRSAFKGGCGEQTGKFACSVLGQGT